MCANHWTVPQLHCHCNVFINILVCLFSHVWIHNVGHYVKMLLREQRVGAICGKLEKLHVLLFQKFSVFLYYSHFQFCFLVFFFLGGGLWFVVGLLAVPHSAGQVQKWKAMGWKQCTDQGFRRKELHAGLCIVRLIAFKLPDGVQCVDTGYQNIHVASFPAPICSAFPSTHKGEGMKKKQAGRMSSTACLEVTRLAY